MNGNIQLCAFNFEGIGVDAVTETDLWYDSPKAGREAAQAILAKYCEIERVWVRKIKPHGHMRTVSMEAR